MRRIIKTGISRASWDTTNSTAKFKSADVQYQNISWLDELLDGGLSIPEHEKVKGRPLTILLKGPPGTGKTTMALEMCYRQANDEEASSLYISSEAEAWKLKNNAEEYGWNENRFYPLRDDDQDEKIDNLRTPHVILWGAMEIFESILQKDQEGREGFIRRNAGKIGKRIIAPLLKSLPVFLDEEKRAAFEPILKTVDQILQGVIQDDNNKKTHISLDNYRMVVVDSLNTVPDENVRSVLFGSFLTSISKIPKPPKIVLFILDSDMPDDGHRYWEHVCDIVIDMNSYYEKTSSYLIRTIEIIKARYQPHVWGKHQIKIYPKQRRDIDTAHPCREEGGVFIYPSIHWFISTYKHIAPESQHEAAATPLQKMNEILGKDPDKTESEGGLPLGRCTAMIGSRGAHKSHLGYYHILNNISKNSAGGNTRERGLIISLRDDAGMATGAMASLVANSVLANRTIDRKKDEQSRRSKANDFIRDAIQNNDLRILYYPPGNITPEEFYHRAVMNLLQLKTSRNNERVNVTVLFNSLDQLSARFPLCTKEVVFIPGLIDTFNAEGVTSIFIAVDEPGQPEHQYGLLTMADLIISFQQRLFLLEDYFGHLKRAAPRNKEISRKVRERFGKEISAVTLRVERFAGGQRAGKGGILELVQTNDLVALYKQLYGEDYSRLVFTPYSPFHSQGEPI